MRKVKTKLFRNALLVFVILFSIPALAFAENTFEYEQDWTVTGTGGAVASEHPLASEAAMRILDQGGNAVEAAIATAAVQGVVRPFSGGIGGGGFMHIYLEDTDDFIVLDHRSSAPASFGPDSFLDESDEEYPDEIRASSGVAAGVPGTVKAWEEALQLYGTGMTLSDVLQPAIEVAENGFFADENYIREITENADRFRAYQSTIDLFLNPDGSVPEAGTLMKNPDLATAYELIAQHGSKVFYEGAIGQAIVNTVNNPPAVAEPPFMILPGDMNIDDLKDYKTYTNDSMKVRYRGYDVYGAPLSSSGGTTMGQVLNTLEGYNMGEIPRAQALHYFIEASRHAFADRTYLGDPATYNDPMPVVGLTSKGYAELVRQKIGETGTQRKIEKGDPWPFDADPNLWPDPLPVSGKNKFSFNFSGLQDSSSWDATGDFTTQVGTGSNNPGVGATIDVQDETGMIDISGDQFAYARAEPDMENKTDSELLIRFKMNDLDDDRRLRFWLRADEWNNTTSPHNGYAVELNSGSDTARIIRTRNSNDVWGLSTFDVERSTEWQWLRFRVEDDQLKVRIWKDGEQEPRQTWTYTLQDTSVSGDGKFLISAIELSGDNASGGSFQIADMYVTELNPSNFKFDFSGLNNGASWEDTGDFATQSNAGGSMDVQDETGMIDLSSAQFAYARAEAEMDLLTDSELLLRFKVNDLGDNRRLRLWLKADEWNSSSAPHNGYGIEINSGSNTARVIRTRNSQGVFGLHTFNLDQTTDWQWLRFRVEDNVLRVRIWEDGTQEPIAWTHQRTNEDVKGPGKLLISAIELTGGGDGGSFQVDDISMYDLDVLKNQESTIHLSVSDSDGNIVAYTNTIAYIGGNAMVVPGYGFLLDNGLTTRVPSNDPEGHPDGPRPGMRTLSSMSPTIVMKDGEPVMALGSPGGQTILTTVLRVMINHIDFGMSLPDAVAAPRFSQHNHSFFGNTLIESEFVHSSEYEELLEMGQLFFVTEQTYGIGAVNAIGFLPDGRVQPVSEPVRRGGGSAMVESLYNPQN
jgi:gamma-glutamyltranspeptidase